MFKKSLAVAKYTVKENISNKIFSGMIMFALIVLGGILLLKEITIYESTMVIKDIGIFLIEFFLLLITVYLSSTTIIKAHKEKSIYLILTKSITRTQYIIGVSFGIFFILGIYLLMLSSVLSLVLYLENYTFTSEYFLVILYTYYKLLILSSLGLLFSVISDSFVTGNIFTFCIYIISHMTYELKVMAEKSGSLITKYILHLLNLILPKYYILNRKDYLLDIDINNYKILLYVLIYLVLALTLNSIIFGKRKL